MHINNKKELLLHIYKLKSAIYIFDKNIKIKIHEFIDLLVIKEIIYDDVYLLSKIKNSRNVVVLDIGAGIGDFAIYVAKRYANSQVISFEPNINNYNLFKQNIMLNNINTVTVYNVAVGTKKRCSFDLEGVQSKAINKAGIIKGVMLGDYINSKINLIKIDAEGSEINILKSIKPKQFKLINNFAIEYHNHIIDNADKKITSILRKYNFKCSIIHDLYNDDMGYIYASKK